MNKQFTRVSLFIGLLLALSAFPVSATEVVYGQSDHTLPCSHFGWYIPTTTFPVSGTLIAGSSSSNVGSGQDAGTYLIEKVGPEIVVTYTLTPGFPLNTVRIYAKCIDPATIPNTNDVCAPDQFNIKNDHPTSPVFTTSFADPGCSTYYFILYGEGSAEVSPPDADKDGVPDDQDQCPDSDVRPTVVIESCNSGVHNAVFPTGCTIADLVAACAEGASNHGNFVSCVAHLTNDLKKAGTITGQQKDAIQSCAGKAHIP